MPRPGPPRDGPRSGAIEIEINRNREYIRREIRDGKEVRGAEGKQKKTLIRSTEKGTPRPAGCLVDLKRDKFMENRGRWETADKQKLRQRGGGKTNKEGAI